ncbi:hypothetical protein SH203_00874 [Brevundimonas sp. SH203]|uniref:hypothetical protein n=1 Tax=Brevundimonas sp. SH203 TaxID=345167 RepID=UPI0009CE5668|nr:hypothetical protein [Brevundimonas sp. SH203]GAW40476.1 hypothetical protein SH203_00874 [Brevundimonas sp. SH203]
MHHRLRFTVAALAFAAATPALAQDNPPQAEDWTLTSVPERKATMATIEFTSGLAIAARCVDGVYDVLITGLPEAPRSTLSRDLGIQSGDQTEPYTSVWSVGTQRNTAFSRLPAVVARDLAKGGRLQVIVPSPTPGGPRTRYVMELNPSSTAIEQTLTACGRPLVDPREARAEEIDGNGQDGLPDTVRWESVPRPTFPESVNGRSPLEGYVVLSCVVTAEGRMTECQTESEHPAGYNLWRSVERSLPRARLKLSDEAAAAGLPLAGRMVRFSVNFKMEP